MATRWEWNSGISATDQARIVQAANAENHRNTLAARDQYRATRGSTDPDVLRAAEGRAARSPGLPHAAREEFLHSGRYVHYTDFVGDTLGGIFAGAVGGIITGGAIASLASATGATGFGATLESKGVSLLAGKAIPGVQPGGGQAGHALSSLLGAGDGSSPGADMNPDAFSGLFNPDGNSSSWLDDLGGLIQQGEGIYHSIAGDGSPSSPGPVQGPTPSGAPLAAAFNLQAMLPLIIGAVILAVAFGARRGR